MHKMCDFYVEIPVGTDFWPKSMHETLMLAVCFSFIRHPPWQIRNTPKVFRLVQDLSGVFKVNDLASGNILRKFLQFQRGLSSMPQNVVWRMLHFTDRDDFPHPQIRGPQRKGKKRKII